MSDTLANLAPQAPAAPASVPPTEAGARWTLEAVEHLSDREVLILALQRLDAVESRVEALVTIAGGLYESASVVTSMLESGGGPLGALLGLGKRK
jgi:hypothetical protein